MPATDVLIVGYGPVGQLLSILVARQGWNVTVVERWPEPYPMPRAVAFDGESARILAAAGVKEFIGSFGEPSGDYSWRNAAGAELLHYVANDTEGLSGWPESTSMYQPGLEKALMARGTEFTNLQVFRGYTATSLVASDDGVEVVAVGTDGEQLVVNAGWVVGCDGANSFVREHIGTGVTDLGFHHDWLICDVVTPPGREFKPNNLQICDPARPTTLVSAGPGHRRWEFMRVPGETVDELNDAATAWKLLAEYDIHPDNATMERHAVYTFEARYADQWRSGRLLIAGDAAHLMPPFAAQGMSSGFRDAANLAWKLHFVMSGLAGAAVLDTYTVERRVHVQHAIEMSVSLGQVICETDPQKVEDRDALMLAMRSRMPDQPQPSAVKPITGGLLHGATGELTPQAQVSHNGRTGYFDEIVGLGFVVLATEPVVSEFLDRIGAHVVVVDEQFDITGTYRAFLAEHGATAAIIRPDYYLFGTASGQEQFAALAADLEAQLA